MALAARIADFWHANAKAAGAVDDTRLWGAFHFGDSEELADSLAQLVLSGVKRATAASPWSFQADGKRVPRAGDLSIVTDWAGTPLCIIETLAVDVVPFNEVTAEFAAAEGEGDGSLAFWREAHTQYFTRECARTGRRFTPDMPVACERFRVVFRPPDRPA
jgi:uncharacterized protein YhfF